MNNDRILIIDEDVAVTNALARYFANQGYDVFVESNGDEVEATIEAKKPDIILLEVDFSNGDGFFICKSLRSEFEGPVLFHTTRSDEVDEVLALESGGDDFLVKPVLPRVLLARIRRHLVRMRSQNDRNNAKEQTKPIRIGPLVITPARRTVELNNKTIRLTTTEFDLLRLLADNVGNALGRDEINRALNGSISTRGRTIDLRISRLRKVLGDDPTDPRVILSVRGVGYMLAQLAEIN